MKEVAYYYASEITGPIYVGRQLSASSGMPWSGGYNPRPQGPKRKLSKQAKTDLTKLVWVEVEWGKGCKIVQIGGVRPN